MGDAPAADPRQVLHGQDRTALVVWNQGQRVGVVRLRKDVNHREPMDRRADGGAPVGTSCRDHEAVDALAEKLVQMLALARGIVGGIAHENRDPLVGQTFLERLDDREGEPSEAVVGDDADGSRSGAVQALGQIVGSIGELPGDPQDPLAGLRAQPAAGVQRLRRRADRDVGHACDVADRQPRARRARHLLGRQGLDFDVVPIRHRYFTTPLRKPET